MEKANKYESHNQFVENINEVDKPLGKLRRENEREWKKETNILKRSSKMVIYTIDIKWIQGNIMKNFIHINLSAQIK